MNDVKATEYLTWEYCSDPDIQYLNCPAPTAMRNHMPDWFKNLKAKKSEIVLGDGSGAPLAENQTLRNCLGFRGLASVGFTIPLPETLDGYDTYFSRGRLHPEMLSGTHWANKPGGPWKEPNGSIDYGPYEYRIRLLHWPWRAKMSTGWRLLILPYLMDWHPDWQAFAGTVEPNYMITRAGTGIGASLKWSQSIDSQYNYYNLETVVAFRRTTTIPEGTVSFTAVPLYDPELYQQQTGDHRELDS